MFKNVIYSRTKASCESANLVNVLAKKIDLIDIHGDYWDFFMPPNDIFFDLADLVSIKSSPYKRGFDEKYF